ncbi:photosystem reaction center subunit H [Microbacterium caowuchunii]|uniref:PRC-barrel domain-containing protein n=1 Tax=Microbacterium caowuchunii TaxID=2614638 RepID=UPI0012493947|nr:PRC-barrel domain-containing protein [Microbacterium caowuchunii]QEV99723.1 photosystem reaction center subunit H [Microbacterium caowuchunii]
MLSSHNIARLVGAHVTDPDGDKIGSVGQIFVDPTTGEPNWATVKTGLFGTKESFVPLEGAQDVDGALRLPFTKDVVKGAPRIDDDSELSEAEEDELYRYYGNHLGTPDGSDPARAAGTDSHSRREDDRDDVHTDGDLRRDPGSGQAGENTPAGTADTSRDAGDRVDTRSDAGDRVDTDAADTETRAGGRQVRLRRYIVAEEATVIDPATGDTILVERESVIDVGDDDGGRSADQRGDSGSRGR